MPTRSSHSSQRSVVVVGAGPAGLSAAAELVDAGRIVTVLEQDPHYVGGISRTVQHNGFRFDLGGHRFFSKNPEIVAWWERRLSQDLVNVARKSRILYGKKFYDYPLRPANALANLGLGMGALCVLSYFHRQFVPIRPERTFEDWVTNRFGSVLFRIFFKTYTEKVWGMPCTEISSDWASQRIKGLSLMGALVHSLRRSRSANRTAKTLIEEFRYPRLGPGMMWERTRDDLVARGVKFAMGRSVVELHREGRRLTHVRTKDVEDRHENWAADAFIVSMPLRDCILGLRPTAPAQVEAAARELRYRDFVTVALMVRRENLFPDQWIYVHDPTVRVGRVQNFGNWSQDMIEAKGTSCLGLEYFCTVGDDLWSATDGELISLASREAQTIGLLEARDVFDAAVHRVEKAYPVYDSGYRARVDLLRGELGTVDNLQAVGRNGMHKYNNQDHSMMTGILAARNLSRPEWDVWRVNTDAEYHEEAADDTAGRIAPRPVA